MFDGQQEAVGGDGIRSRPHDGAIRDYPNNKTLERLVRLPVLTTGTRPLTTLAIGGGRVPLSPGHHRTTATPPQRRVRVAGQLGAARQAEPVPARGAGTDLGAHQRARRVLHLRRLPASSCSGPVTRRTALRRRRSCCDVLESPYRCNPVAEPERAIFEPVFDTV